MLTRIKANTDLVVAQLGPQSGIEFGLNAASIAYVEAFIERQRVRGLSEGATDRLVSVFGSFLGECIIASYGGRWVEHAGGWGISFGGHTMAFPFTKVRKQFDDGLTGGESIASFYRFIPIIFREQIASLNVDSGVYPFWPSTI